MTTAMHQHERVNDSSRAIMNRIILWGSVLGAAITIFGVLGYTANVYVRFTSALKTAPENSMRIEKLERWQEIQDERTYNIEWWMSKIGEKAGISAPPPHRHRGS